MNNLHHPKNPPLRGSRPPWAGGSSRASSATSGFKPSETTPTEWEPPAYDTDLNAMRDARANLSPGEQVAYVGHLLDVLGCGRTVVYGLAMKAASEHVWAVADATVEEHAEAFCRTLGI